MAIFENNILKDEEISGGFTPNSASDESFLLNTMDNYPGSLPDFSAVAEVVPEEPIIEQSEPIIETEEEPLIDTPDEAIPESDSDSVWNIFNENESNVESNVEAENNIPAENQTEEMDYSSLFSQDEAQDDIDLDSDDELEALLRKSMQEESSPQEILKEPQINNIPEPKQFETPNNDMVNSQADFKPVDFADGAKEFDISDIIIAAHPSTAGIDTQALSEEQTTDEPKKKKAKVPKDKKRNSGLIKKIGLIAAIVLIASGLAGGLYYFGFVDSAVHYVKGMFQQDTTLAHETEIKQDSVLSKHAEATKTVADAHQSVVSHNAEEQTPNHNNTEVHIEPKQDVPEHTEVKTEPVQEHKVETSKVEPKQEETHHAAITEHNAPEPVKEKPVRQTPKPKKEIVRAAKPEIKKEEKLKAKIVQDELYTIQVYSSPSKIDAEEWTRKIKKKYSGDVHISPQQVRDRIWYRVRCGYFKNKEEAKSAASELGFSQYWIDRVK